jgi:uncharacterized protein YjbI with pentapeptide repeats
MLIGVNLKGVSFREAVLSEAHLEGANLGCRGPDQGESVRASGTIDALDSNRQEEGECCPAPAMCSDLSKANLRSAKLANANLKYANLRNADLRDAELMDADLRGADLEGANLSNAMLDRARLSCATLQNANLQMANLNGSKLQRSNLTKANFSNAKLFNAHLNYAYLLNTTFSKAALDGADLSYAQLIGTDLQDTKLTGAKLKDAKYQSLTTPSEAHLTGLQDLETVRFNNGEQAGLVLLRTALQTRGLRDLERKATFAIQSGMDKHEMGKIEKWNERPLEALDAIGPSIRYIAFNKTTAYGMHPERALVLIILLVCIFACIYLKFILQMWPSSNEPGKVSGIYFIMGDRIEMKWEPQINKEVVVKRVHHRGWKAICYAFYFSLLSAFNIGFREITIGNWISRLQRREYTFRAEGWVRVFAGVQSLLSLYMLAMWLLTYFGRPFQ